MNSLLPGSSKHSCVGLKNCGWSSVDRSKIQVFYVSFRLLSVGLLSFGHKKSVKRRDLMQENIQIIFLLLQNGLSVALVFIIFKLQLLVLRELKATYYLCVWAIPHIVTKCRNLLNRLSPRQENIEEFDQFYHIFAYKEVFFCSPILQDQS